MTALWHGKTKGHPEWLTPKPIIDELGPFDLDPCSPIVRPWPTAARHYTIEDDGLAQPWRGRVWLNPPYGRETGRWLARMAEHGDGIALVFARTETRMFFDYIWPRTSGVLFVRGRINFCDVAGKQTTAGVAPSLLVAYGAHNAAVLARCTIPGAMVRPENRLAIAAARA